MNVMPINFIKKSFKFLVGLVKKRNKKKQNKKTILLGSLLALFIVLTPLLLYLQEIVPEDSSTWETPFFGYTYHSGFWENVEIGIWVLMMKVTPLVFLLIWFLTCRHWWYHALLVPISVYVYQVLETINIEIKYVSTEKDIVLMIPIVGIVVLTIYIVRFKMLDKLIHADKTMAELEEEFKFKPNKISNILSYIFDSREDRKKFKMLENEMQKLGKEEHLRKTKVKESNN